MKLIFCNKAVTGHVETVEVHGFPGVEAQISKDGLANICFSEAWSEEAAQQVVKTLAGVENAELQKSEDAAWLDEIVTIEKNEDLMLQTAWGYVSREKGKDKPVVDISGDIMPVEELRKGVHHFMKTSRVVRDAHTSKIVGHVVEAVVLDAEMRKHILGLEDGEDIPDGHDGVLLKTQYTDRDFWNNEIKTGNKLAMSLGGRARRTPLT